LDIVTPHIIKTIGLARAILATFIEEALFMVAPGAPRKDYRVDWTY